jgi:hypothetical protein
VPLTCRVRDGRMSSTQTASPPRIRCRRGCDLLEVQLHSWIVPLYCSLAVKLSDSASTSLATGIRSTFSPTSPLVPIPANGSRIHMLNQMTVPCAVDHVDLHVVADSLGVVGNRDRLDQQPCNGIAAAQADLQLPKRYIPCSHSEPTLYSAEVRSNDRCLLHSARVETSG